MSLPLIIFGIGIPWILSGIIGALIYLKTENFPLSGVSKREWLLFSVGGVVFLLCALLNWADRKNS